jgi:hypothetical protein
LISAVLAQAARYSTRSEALDFGKHFAGRALQLLPNDIDRGSSIPTIQGLLILSARECGCGRTSQGWLYSGMAFRMMRDLGMHIDSKKMSYLARQFSDEELALRQQVFWSCFTWDKTMSLCLGRAPIIHDTIDIPSKETLIDGQETDDELWIPVLGQAQESMAAFNAQKSLGSARFAAYCKLCAIIDGVLDGLYCRPHQSRQDHLLAFLDNTIQKLENWSTGLAEDLFISMEDKVLLCPPIHVSCPRPALLQPVDEHVDLAPELDIPCHYDPLVSAISRNFSTSKGALHESSHDDRLLVHYTRSPVWIPIHHIPANLHHVRRMHDQRPGSEGE